MTEHTTSFAGTSLAEPPAPPLPMSVDEADDNRRKLVLVGAIVAVLVVAVAAFFLLKGNGSSDNAAGTPGTPVHHVTPPASGHKGSAAGHPITLPKPYKGKVGRDPFKPLYVAPVAAPSDTSGGSKQKPSTPPTTTTGGVPTTSTGGSQGGSGQPSTGQQPPPPARSYAPVWVELVSVKGTSSATFLVDYSNGKKNRTATFSNVQAPTSSLRTTFASVFALLSIQDGTATVQFGDGTPFDLGKGFGNRHFVG